MTVVMSAALCADRAAAFPAPVHPRPQPASVASRVMDRLSLSLRRVVPSVKVIETRREGNVIEAPVTVPQPPLVAQRPLSPFQFRLPPPSA
jgi:hypothetical protein